MAIKKEKGQEEGIILGRIEPREITDELKQSYLDYAMSVIVSRALPDVRDGMKPVHRRVLWAMWGLGITSTAKLRKSANVVGEVLGSYHPHGDQAVYDTITRMVQDFSLRYPLLVGQGNWGSPEGDAAAAMRYTECKMSKISEELLIDIEKETVDWVDNYDGRLKEPRVLPAKVPNLLINGGIGIAVGMATSIPPHNLGEVIDATIHMIENPECTGEDLLQYVKGPDFPTGGIIYNKKDIQQAYLTGRGSVVCRGVTEIEDSEIIISEFPYQTNISDFLIKIAELVNEKKIEGIRDVRNETDKDGVRIVIELKRDAVPQKILNLLYKHTDLQKSFHFNMLALHEGIQPRIHTLLDIIGAHISHRKVVVRRRAEFDLKKAKERAHILEGLKRALDDIDAVIKTIKKSADREEASINLMKKFDFTEIQAGAILEMRLSTLANLEVQKIIDELKEKHQLIADLEALLKSEKKILALIKDEMMDLKERFADARRTKVVMSGLKEFSEADLIAEEEAIITLSRGGYIKRLAPDTYKSQHRGGKGLIGSEVAEEDFISHITHANTHDNILFFTSRGRVFQTKVWEIPVALRTSKGKAIQSFLEIPSSEEVTALVSYSDQESDGYLVMTTEKGVVKKTALSDFANVRRGGIIAISLHEGDMLHFVKRSTGKDEVVLTTVLGQAIRFSEDDIRAMGRVAAGVTGIRLHAGDMVSSLTVIDKEAAKKAKFLVIMDKGYGKKTRMSEYKTQGRGGSGILTAKITNKTGKLISAHLITEEKDLFVLSAKGQMIRTTLESVREASRATQGVRLMSLNDADYIIGSICLKEINGKEE
ncbi:MAG: DNA gyrase subunit A [Candidatus Harrisonbacteria bacterium]|nr:DNA gyrase subunit A [Candidatus Harrisonbacteria bacterium]